MKELMEKMAQEKDMNKDSDVEAKLEVLMQLHEMASSVLNGELEEVDMDMEDLEQVTVAAEDKEGLEEGLDKAKDMLGGSDNTGDFY